MPSQLSIDSLKALMGGPSGRPRVMPMENYRFAGSVPTQGELESPFEQEQAARAAAADARDREAVAKIQATNAGVNEYNRPDVAGIRQEEEQNALRRLIMPLQVKGEYDVRAAQQHANAASANTNALIAGRQGVADTNQGAVAAREAARLKQQALMSEAAQLGKKKYSGGLWSTIMGNSEQDADKARIAAINAELSGLSTGMGPGEEADMGAPVANAAPTSESPAARMARLRAAMGR